MYSVGVSNIFELLGEEGQEGKNVNLARAKTVEPTQQSGSKQTSQQTTAKPQQQKSEAPAKGNQQQKSGERGGRGRGRGGFRGGRGGDRPPRFDSGVPAGAQKERSGDKKEERTREERQRDRRDNERGEHQGRGKRVYERRSGTGRGKEVKKGGAGRGGWGTNDESQVVNEEVAEQQQQQEDETKGAEAPAEGTEGKAEVEAPAKPQRELTEEEKKKLEEEEAERIKEEKMMTIDEYKQKKEDEKKRLASLALPAPRLAGEGVQNKEWEKYVVLSREDEKKAEDAKKDDKKKEAKKGSISVDQVLDIKTPPPYGKKPRDDNYKPKGGAGARGGKRGGKRGGSSVALDNQAFPPLSTKA